MDAQAGTGTGSGSGGVLAFLRRDPEAFDGQRGTGRALTSLPEGTLSSRFCAWRGASDRRYVASVYAVDRDAVDAGLPAFEGFVLMAVTRDNCGRRILAVSAIERVGDRNAALACGLAGGVQEWHVHFLAEDRRERLAMVADLSERHGGAAEARCA